jgi:hypothetical protein
VNEPLIAGREAVDARGGSLPWPFADDPGRPTMHVLAQWGCSWPVRRMPYQLLLPDRPGELEPHRRWELANSTAYLAP